MSPRAVFLGMATTDFIATVPHLPRADEVFELVDFNIQGGGPAATAAVAFSRLGGSASFAGAVGSDSVSLSLAEELRGYGVDTSLLVHQPTGHAPRSVILVEAATGRRSIMYSRGTAPEPGPSAGLAAAIRSAAALHLEGFHIGTALEAARLAREAGVTVSFDGGAGDPWPGVADLLPLVDLLVVARGFAERETGQSDPVAAAARLAQPGTARAVVITDGAKGAWYVSGAEAGFVPALGIEAVDTTGAGDVFHGAFLHAHLAGQGVRDAVRFASATAALKCLKPGGRQGIPDLKAVEALLAESPG